MDDDASRDVAQHWKGDRIVLSYIIAVTGSYCSMCLPSKCIAFSTSIPPVCLTNM
jgi:hypothetical protein